MRDQEKQRLLRRKNIAVAMVIVGVIILFYLISLIRLGGLD